MQRSLFEPDYRLTKSSFLAGVQCLKRLWLQTHEPAAEELTPGVADRWNMRQGTELGLLARTYVPGGRAIQRVHRDLATVLQESKVALADRGTRAVYEAAALADGTLVFADILERHDDQSFTLIEVKGVSSVGDEHLWDAAIQVHVLRASGVGVTRAEVMHLNRECRHPNLEDLFIREDVTEQVEELLPQVGASIQQQIRTLDGPTPEAVTGQHCGKPRECPFHDRCWPALPEHHVSTLYRIQKKKAAEYEAQGYRTIPELPEDLKLSTIAARQRRSVRNGSVEVERPALIQALGTLRRPVAHIDFETVMPWVPVWPGCRPFDQVPVQLSCHVVHDDGSVRHYAWLAESGEDPRRGIARAIVEATAGAETITAYFSSFEQQCIRLVAEAVPELATELERIAGSLVDLLPIVREHVYHPEFRGSFSLKKVLPALVPELGYSDLTIAEGETASVELARMLLAGDTMDAVEKARLRDDLLRYCERDTLAMVELTSRLERLAQ